jgi:hypothetical protein
MRARFITFAAITAALALSACASNNSPSGSSNTDVPVSIAEDVQSTPTVAPATDAPVAEMPPPLRYDIRRGKQPRGTVAVSDTFWCESGKPVSGVLFEDSPGNDAPPYGDAPIGANDADSVRITHWVKTNREYLANLGCGYAPGDHEWADEYQGIVLSPSVNGHVVVCRPETCTVDGVEQRVRFIQNAS